jgi:hypothetical protein
MSLAAMERIIDRWHTDATFREKLRTNADVALQSSGEELDGSDLEALRSIEWNLPDQQLEERISKLF